MMYTTAMSKIHLFRARFMIRRITLMKMKSQWQRQNAGAHGGISKYAFVEAVATNYVVDEAERDDDQRRQRTYQGLLRPRLI